MADQTSNPIYTFLTRNAAPPSLRITLLGMVGLWIVSGAVNIRELNRTQGWHLPTEGPKTLNGLILELLETIPAPTTCLKINGYPVEIVETDENRVRTVRIGERVEEVETEV